MQKKIAVLLAIALGLSACGKKPAPADDSRYVKLFQIGSGVEQAMSTFHGIVHAEYEPNLSFRVAGKIIKRNVDIGQAVKQGDVLASLDQTDYKLSADSANALLASAKSNYVTQEANLARYRQLLAQNFVSQAQYDTQKAQFDSAKAQYEQAQNQLQNSDNQVNYTTLKAPSDGVITSINMDAGQVVSAGQVVATMAVSGSKEVAIELPEVQINNYKVGMPASIKLWATSQTYSGVVRTINQASDQQTRTYTARVVINNADDNIKYGMAADVTIVPLNSSAGIELPLSSIYANNNKTYVWTLDKNSEANLVPVVVLETDGSSVKVQSSELKNGQRVVSAGANFIHQGQKLREY